MAVKIDGSQLSKLTDLGAVDFVAFHGVENDTNTVILMGLDSAGKFVKDANNEFKILERWGKFGSSVAAVNDDINELMDIFD